jgi:hypothetical protein
MNLAKIFVAILFLSSILEKVQKEVKMINPQAIPQDAAYFPSVPAAVSPVSQLREKYQKMSFLYQKQPEDIRYFINAQAQHLGQAVVEPPAIIRFSLPPQVVVQNEILEIPASRRQQVIGGLFDRAARKDIRVALKKRLATLERTSDPALTISTGLIRYAIAVAIVHTILPSGNNVVYEALDGDEIPNTPVRQPAELPTPVTGENDFLLPEWVALNSEGSLLVSSLAKAHACLAAMQQYLDNLQVAIDLAPYMVVDEVYQQKRYGLVGQLVNQGRALAWYETKQAITLIERRAAAQDLNRGLSLSLPYFDDSGLAIKTHDFTIIPPGRYMYVPAFVVLAARREISLVAQDTRLSLTSRKYLLAELSLLEKAFMKLDGFAL